MNNSELKPTTASLSSENLTHFKTLFEKQKKSLLYTAMGLTPSAFSLGQDDIKDETDLSATETEQSMRMRLRNREALYLRKIDDALERIRLGTFGECDDCGEKIDARRLEARPTSSLCVSCKEAQEHLESAHIDGRKPKSLGSRMRFA